MVQYIETINCPTPQDGADFWNRFNSNPPPGDVSQYKGSHRIVVLTFVVQQGTVLVFNLLDFDHWAEQMFPYMNGDTISSHMFLIPINTVGVMDLPIDGNYGKVYLLPQQWNAGEGVHNG